MPDLKRKTTSDIDDIDESDRARVRMHDAMHAHAAGAAVAATAAAAAAADADAPDTSATSTALSTTIVGPTPSLHTRTAVGDAASLSLLSSRALSAQSAASSVSAAASPVSAAASPVSAAASSVSAAASSVSAAASSELPDPLAASAHAGPFTDIQRDMNDFFTTAYLTDFYIRRCTLNLNHAAADKWIVRLRRTINDWSQTTCIECAFQKSKHAQHAEYDIITENYELCELACEKGKSELELIDARRMLPVLEAEVEKATAAYEKRRQANAAAQHGAHPLGLLTVR